MCLHRKCLPSTFTFTFTITFTLQRRKTRTPHHKHTHPNRLLTVSIHSKASPRSKHEFWFRSLAKGKIPSNKATDSEHRFGHWTCDWRSASWEAAVASTLSSSSSSVSSPEADRVYLIFGRKALHCKLCPYPLQHMNNMDKDGNLSAIAKLQCRKIVCRKHTEKQPNAEP